MGVLYEKIRAKHFNSKETKIGMMEQIKGKGKKVPKMGMLRSVLQPGLQKDLNQRAGISGLWTQNQSEQSLNRALTLLNLINAVEYMI